MIRTIIGTLRRNDMRRRLIIAMVMAAILPPIVLSIGLYYYNIIPVLDSFIGYNRDLLDNQFAVEQNAWTQHLADELSDYFHEIEVQATVLSSITDNETLPLMYRSSVIREYLNRFPRILWLYSSSGIQVGVSDSVMQNILKTTLSGDLELAQIGASELRISKPLQVPTHSSESLIVLSVPSVLRTGNDIMMLAELPPVETLTDNLKADGAIAVVDKNGVLLLKSEKSDVELGTVLTGLSVVEEFVNSGTTGKAFNYKRDDGEVVRGIISPVAMVNWGLLTESKPANTTGVMLEMEAYASDLIRRLVLASILAVLSVGLLAGSIGALVAVQYTKPLRQILKGIDVIKAGDYSHEFSNKGPPDLCQLSDTLNSMTGSIRQSTEALQQHAEQMREMFMGSVTALVTAIDAKDPYTRGHSRRVQVISIVIGRNMGMENESLQDLEISALMHDIGKLGVDEALLRKPGMLTADERICLEQHPVFGAEIMRHIPMFRNMLPGMLHHHERWDGTGYPDGLLGESIPLYGRIIAVADTFDAMTSTRPYQETLTYDEARELIIGWSGTRYDPLVVDSFEKGFREICQISESIKTVVETTS